MRQVSLRAFTAGDCERLIDWIESEDALYLWAGPRDFSWPLDPGQLLRDLGMHGDSRFLFAANDPSGELVGHAKLEVQPHHRSGQIGRVLIAPPHRGRGLGSALMGELVTYSFDELRLHRLQLGVYTFNAAAIAAYERAGFVVEGELRDLTRSSTGYWNGFVMGMLESDRRPAAAPAPDGCVIRAARQADRHQLAELLTQLGYPQDESQVSQRLLAWTGKAAGTVLVAELDGSPAGVIAVHRVPYFERPGAFARIVALSVDGRRRRGGIGRRLVLAAEEWAAARGCVDIEVTSRRVRHDAHRFYAALGYDDQCRRSGRLKRALAPPSPPAEQPAQPAD
jgi:RimJ/RimL family protein N-acetyltransferase